jgi:omega-6 fatty acid desaturase (delta-12 desaturase)
MKISDYKANNSRAFLFLISPVILLFLGILLCFYFSGLLYGLGILFLSFFLTQTFILLHECGHQNFFESDRLNSFFGNVFGLFSFIPFHSWKHMHNLHHRWTGWRDKDPTTEKTVEPSKSPVMRVVANVCWFLFIPIFYLFYMFSNYWNFSKIRRFLNEHQYRFAIVSVIAYAVFYGMVFYFFWKEIKCSFLPAFLMSLVWKELIILTQHTHIEIPISNGEEVKPISYKDQVQFTRSFYTWPFLSKYFLFNFNLHEAHHVYPGMPAYWLDQIDLNVPKQPTYSEWFHQAKSMSGVDFVFRTSKHTNKNF